MVSMILMVWEIIIIYSFVSLYFQSMGCKLQMWSQLQNSQSQQLKWKYGLVTIAPSLNHPHLHRNQYLITTDPFYHPNPNTIHIRSSERNKCLESLQHLCALMLKKGVNRDSTVFVKGGGMLLDFAGFACSIYMRGVGKVVFCPTTLLAIVDATVGGKNGVNWEGAKNMLGVMRHPNQIQIDLSVLETLPDRDFSNGLAEIIKMAVTHDGQLFEYLERPERNLGMIRKDKEGLRDMIKRSLEIKIKIVEGDQLDKSSRQWLNFGHTVGHAVEMSRWGKNLKHGECVSIGMVKELEIGIEQGQIPQGLLKRVKRVLQKFHLPVSLQSNQYCEGEADTNQIIENMRKDKKNKSMDEICLTLVDEIGQRKGEQTAVGLARMQEILNESVEVVCMTALEGMEGEVNRQWDLRFPSSKSLSIRYLYLAALYYLKTKNKIQITNFLNSDDTNYLKISLIALGFLLVEDPQRAVIQVVGYEARSKGELDVGNSGLTARFILPLCGLLAGEWRVNCHPRMSQRPNQEIMRFCEENYEMKLNWKESEKLYCFPLTVRSSGKFRERSSPVHIKSSQSSQFISSVLLNLTLDVGKVHSIETTAGKLVSEPYIMMTMSCLRKFGVFAKLEKFHNRNRILLDCTRGFQPISQVQIEKDLSSLSYPYAFSIMHGTGTPNLPQFTTQGDILFYKYCQIDQLPQNLPFDECTDTFMTMAVLIATLTLKMKGDSVRISKIENQRVKESNRILLTRLNLQKIGYVVEETSDGLRFHKNCKIREIERGETIVFETAGDHRLAMSMALLSTFLKKKYPHSHFIIDDKNAVKKTFPGFWDYLQSHRVVLESKISNRELSHKKSHVQRMKSRTLYMIGNRGCGKSTVGRLLASQLLKNGSACFADLDEIITERLRVEWKCESISCFVDAHGWEQFRRIEAEELQRVTTSHCFGQGLVISTGGGIVECEQSQHHLRTYAKNSHIIYLEREFNDLRIQHNAQRPPLPDFEQRSKMREVLYEQLATDIITVPRVASREKENAFLRSEFARIMSSDRFVNLPPGYVYCLGRLDNEEGKCEILDASEREQLSAIELRCDLLLEASGEGQSRWRELRKMIAKFKMQNDGLVPILLTLRTEEELGKCKIEDYSQGFLRLQKIPHHFIDHQISQSIPALCNHFKLLHSYHGNDPLLINHLFSRNFELGSRKLCYSSPFVSSAFHKANAAILVNLDHPPSRLQNKYKMCIRDGDSCNLIRIMSRWQLKSLQKLAGFFP